MLLVRRRADLGGAAGLTVILLLVNDAIACALARRQRGRRAWAPPLLAGAALLLVRSGPTAGARYLLDTDVTTIGRHPEADIFFDDVTVSRRHAEVTRTGGFFELVDQRSLNGSYVNGERVDRSILVDGAEVRIGKFRLNFFASPVDRDQVTPDQAIRG